MTLATYLTLASNMTHAQIKDLSSKKVILPAQSP